MKDYVTLVQMFWGQITLKTNGFPFWKSLNARLGYCFSFKIYINTDQNESSIFVRYLDWYRLDLLWLLYTAFYTLGYSTISTQGALCCDLKLAEFLTRPYQRNTYPVEDAHAKKLPSIC